MSVLHTIMLVVAIGSLIGIIIAFLSMIGLVPLGHRAGAEDYDNPALLWLLRFVVTLAADIVVAAVLYLWEKDSTHISPCILAGLVLAAVGRFLYRTFGPTCASWLHKLVMPAAPSTPSKKPWLSKTILFNTVVSLLLLAEAKLSFLQGVLPDSKYQIAAFGLPLVNLLLRTYTTQGLSLKVGPPASEASQ